MSAAIDTSFYGSTARIICPFCSESRRKSRLKEMTLTRKDGAVLYYCHHCDANGSVQEERKLSAVPLPRTKTDELRPQHIEWLSSRGISEATAKKAKLFAAKKYFARLNMEADAVGFPYFRDGNLVGVKYRSITGKDFTQEAGGSHDFFGVDAIVPDKPIVIVEGEMDALTLMEIGVENALSVPGGAPMKVADGKVTASEDKKFAFVWNAREALEKAPYIILATDQDPPGQALAEELARRIGKEKCRVAKFDAKDFNEVLMDKLRFDPAQDIKEILEGAEPYPISGLSDASAYADRLNDLYVKGLGSGASTGYSNLDQIYTIAPGQLTIVTGYPSSGKSNFVDQMMVNLARGQDFKFAVASFENQPEIHIVRLMEIYTGKRFFNGDLRMTEKEKDLAFNWVKEHFLFIDSAEEVSTIDSILDRARAAVKRMGVRGLVIDPYNFIERTGDATETDAISQMLTKVQKFAKLHEVHVWFVAHPSKIQRLGGDAPRPDGMTISGSAAWWAKADCGLTIHRGQGSEVEIAVWKCRYRWVGIQGETTLNYDATAGTYLEGRDRF